MKFLLLVPGLLVLAAPSLAQPVQRRAAPGVKDAMRRCRLLPLPQVVDGARARMGDARWIGADLDILSCVYTLKFLRDGAVIWVEMDGQSGRYLGQTGN
ncbi:hypothetical protein [Sphingomonas aracearum]|nr:hypothetical protein [Sphingomonas aracearum]